MFFGMDGKGYGVSMVRYSYSSHCIFVDGGTLGYAAFQGLVWGTIMDSGIEHFVLVYGAKKYGLTPGIRLALSHAASIMWRYNNGVLEHLSLECFIDIHQAKLIA
jgi:hypothetical protein